LFCRRDVIGTDGGNGRDSKDEVGSGNKGSTKESRLEY
jgi:hypothetical protein